MHDHGELLKIHRHLKRFKLQLSLIINHRLDINLGELEIYRSRVIKLFYSRWKRSVAQCPIGLRTLLYLWIHLCIFIDKLFPKETSSTVDLRTIHSDSLLAIDFIQYLCYGVELWLVANHQTLLYE